MLKKINQPNSKERGGKESTDRKMYTTESECDESFNSTFPCVVLLLWSGDNVFRGSTRANMTDANPETRNWGMTIKTL